MASLPAWTKPIVKFVFQGEVFCASHTKAREARKIMKTVPEIFKISPTLYHYLGLFFPTGPGVAGAR